MGAFRHPFPSHSQLKSVLVQLASRRLVTEHNEQPLMAPISASSRKRPCTKVPSALTPEPYISIPHTNACTKFPAPSLSNPVAQLREFCLMRTTSQPTSSARSPRCLRLARCISRTYSCGRREGTGGEGYMSWLDSHNISTYQAHHITAHRITLRFQTCLRGRWI